LVGRYVLHYNTKRLQSAIGYITPKDKLENREHDIFTARKLKLQQARERRIASKKLSPIRFTATSIPAVDRARKVSIF